MKKVRMLMLVGALLSLLAVSSAFADAIVVTYDDPSSNFTPPEGGNSSLIMNGDFSLWENGAPKYWTVNAPSKAGWENTHLAQADLGANYADGTNLAMGFFIRNIGGSGSQIAYATQKLDMIPAQGHYVVNVSVTAFYDVATGPYNSVAWYAISDSEDPTKVTGWRELFPDTVVCRNSAQSCWYGGRHETVSIAPNQYFHLAASQKFPFFNSWTTYLFDDINIVAAGGEGKELGTAGYYDWVHADDTRVTVRWNQYAPR